MPWWLGALAAGLLALVLAVLLGQRRRRSRRAGDAVIPSPATEPLTPEPSPPSQAVVEPHTPDESNRPPSAPAPAAGTPIVLTIKNGPRRGEAVRLVLAPSALIGRAGVCALALRDDDEVSGQHARLTAQGGRVLLADIGSTNGTQVNGVPLTAPTPVHDGDVVRVGQTELHVGGVGRW
jgi:pSer/pThr/pTyr-binding forkhead associated (FHA) protein